MNNQLQVFNNPEFGQVRIIAKENQPWFVGKDVAEILSYSNPLKAIRDHVDDEDKGVNEMDTPGGKQAIITINESGLYSLILSSKLPSAKKFKHWVTSEVLPQIRQAGGYIPSNDNDSDDAIMAKALLIAQNKIKLKNKVIVDKERQLLDQRPKVVFADAVSASRTSILIGELAKILRQNGVNIGEKRLFEWLRNMGYLISRRGTDFNMPTQKSMDLKLFEIKETPICHADGHITISKTTKVKGKGQIYFINKFKEVN
jgi:anti-repressor protein